MKSTLKVADCLYHR